MYSGNHFDTLLFSSTNENDVKKWVLTTKWLIKNYLINMN
jgi:hypothetical protein